jgi:ABC-type glutathione transport system ATPase component
MKIDIPISDADVPPLLRVSGLSKRYTRGGMWRGCLPVTAVARADFEIAKGKTLALVGRSGSGKSTAARCVARLEKPDAGEIWLHGTDIAKLRERDLRPFRHEIQMIFQDAVTSMNPRFSAEQIIAEPLLIQGSASHEDRRARAHELMAEVGILPTWAARLAFDFSGGQRQRLAIARALALKPRLLVLDEALSALDLSSQAQIANLLLELQATHSLTYLFISHDLALVSRLADEIAVIAAGEIVERGPTSRVVGNPRHGETKALLACARRFQSSFEATGRAPR